MRRAETRDAEDEPDAKRAKTAGGRAQVQFMDSVVLVGTNGAATTMFASHDHAGWVMGRRTAPLLL